MDLLRQGQDPVRAKLDPAHHGKKHRGNHNDGHQGGEDLHHTGNSQQSHNAHQKYEYRRCDLSRHSQKLLHSGAYAGSHDDDHAQQENI